MQALLARHYDESIFDSKLQCRLFKKATESTCSEGVEKTGRNQEDICVPSARTLTMYATFLTQIKDLKRAEAKYKEVSEINVHLFLDLKSIKLQCPIYFAGSFAFKSNSILIRMTKIV